MRIKGFRTSSTWDETEEREYTLNEINEILKGRKHSIFLLVLKYTINGFTCLGSGLTLWDETHAPVLRNDKLVVSTYFRRADLGSAAGEGDPEEPILVDVHIDPKDPILSLSILRVHLAQDSMHSPLK